VSLRRGGRRKKKAKEKKKHKKINLTLLFCSLKKKTLSSSESPLPFLATRKHQDVSFYSEDSFGIEKIERNCIHVLIITYIFTYIFAFFQQNKKLLNNFTSLYLLFSRLPSMLLKF